MSEADLAFPFYVTWEHPGQKGEICISSVPLRALSTRILRAAGRDKPSDVGGLLWGTIAPTERGKSLIVNQVEFVPSEGEFFNRTPADREKLQIAMARPRAELEPIGYFRSDFSGSGELAIQERSFLHEYLANPNFIALLICPDRSGTCLARLAYWSAGQLKTSPALLPISRSADVDRSAAPALARKAAATGSVREFEPALPLAPVGTRRDQEIVPHREDPFVHPDADAEVALPVHEDVERPASRLQRVLTLLGMIVAIAGLAAYLVVSLRSYWGARDLSLGLQVTRKADGQLNVTWNGSLPQLRSADGAILSIADGNFHRDLDLSREQLQSGSLAYFPRTDDVRFHLEIFFGSERRSLSESMEVLSPTPLTARSDLPQLAGEAFSRNGSRLNNSVRKPSPETVKGAAPNQSAAPNPPPVKIAIAAPSVPRAAATALEDAPPLPGNGGAFSTGAPPLIAGSLGVPAPPPADTTPKETKPAPKPEIASPAVAPQPASEPPAVAAKTVNTNPVKMEASPAAADTGKQPPARAAASAPMHEILTYAPQPVKQVLPNTRPFGASIVEKETEIAVQVSVDENGRVFHAQVEGPGQRSPLAAQAIAAAKKWRFKPATRGDVPIEGTYTITFHFRPTR